MQGHPYKFFGILRRATIVAALVALVLPAGALARARSRTLDATANLTLDSRRGTTFKQSGTIRGSPFGSGTIAVTISFRRGVGYTSFSASLPRGTVRGRGAVTLTVRRLTSYYNGSVAITGATGRYRGARSGVIRVTGSGPISASRSTIRLTGTVRY
jgi:hypothetical protein